MAEFTDKETEEANLSQNKLFETLQQILSENLEINRQNTDEIKDSVKAAQDLDKPFQLTSEAARDIRKATRETSSVHAIINSKLEERNNFLRDTKSIKKDIEKTESIANTLSSERGEIQKKQMQASKKGNDEAAYIYQDINRGLQAQIDQTNDINANLQKELKHAENIKNATGLTGKSLGVINKLTGGQITDLAEIQAATNKQLAAKEKQGKLEDGLGGKMQGFAIQIKEIGKSMYKNLNDPLVILQQLMNFSNQTRDLQRGLAISGAEAYNFRNEMSEAAALSGDLLVTSAGLIEANQTLNSLRGTGVMFTKEQLLDTNRLLKAEVLTAEAAGELSKLANVTGQGIREAYLNQIDGVLAAEKESGVRLDIKGTLEATNKISGQIRAQLGANPALIAKAVSQAKALGMELEDVAAAGKSFLDFQSSIEKELEAELLIGKQLNLEKARLAALTGDYETLTSEINKNVGDFYEFSKLNVLQQDALAASMGMNTDQLSEQLLKKADLNALAQEAREDGREDIAANLEALSASDKLNASMDKLKGVFGDILGILSPIIEGVASLVGYISESTAAASILVGVVGVLAIRSLVVAIMNIWSSFMSIGPWGIVGAIAGTAAIAAIYASFSSKKMAEGGIVKPTPGGTLATIGEGGQPEAVVPLSKATEMGFNNQLITKDTSNKESSGVTSDDLLTALRTVEKEKPKQPIIIREKDTNYSDSNPQNNSGNNYSIKYQTSFS